MKQFFVKAFLFFTWTAVVWEVSSYRTWWDGEVQRAIYDVPCRTMNAKIKEMNTCADNLTVCISQVEHLQGSLSTANSMLVEFNPGFVPVGQTAIGGNDGDQD